MKAKLAALAVSLMPLLAFAESEYTACVKSYGRARLNYAMPDVRDLSSFTYATTGYNYYAGGASYAIVDNGYGYGVGLGMSHASVGNSWFFANNTAVLEMAKACRHLIKVQRPAYRIVAVKSPALRTAINVPSRKEPAKPR